MAETETPEYLKSMKMVLFTTKILGLFPFVLYKKDSWSNLFISYATLAISLTFYAIAFSSCLLVMSENLTRLAQNFSFVYLVRVGAYLNLRIYVLMVPLAIWDKSEQFVHFWKRWKIFEDELETVTEARYRCGVKGWLIFIAFLPPFSLVFAGVVRSTLTDWDTRTLVSVITSISISNATLAYWSANCLYFQDVLKHLAETIRKTIHRRKPDHVKLRKLTILWIRLCDLIELFSTMHSVIFLAQIVLSVLNTISILYSAITYFVVEGEENKFVTDMVGSIGGLLVTCIYCETAYAVHVHQLRPKFQRILLDYNYNEMNSDFLTSLRLFLNVIETRDPKISLNGFVFIDRSTFTAGVSASMNLLIILRQFGSSSK